MRYDAPVSAFADRGHEGRRHRRRDRVADLAEHVILRAAELP
jgi:hypothetical protein